MRNLRRKYYIFLILVVCWTFQQSGRAESAGDHRGPEESSSPSVSQPVKTQTVQSSSSSQTGRTLPPPVRIITRQEALVDGLKSIKIERKALEELIKFTEENPNINPDRFARVVDQIVEEQPLVVTQEQASKLKELFEKELGPVEGSELGTEFNLAAQRVLTETEQAVLDGSGEPGASDVENRDGLPDIRKAKGLETDLSKKFEEEFGKKSEAGDLQEKLNSELSKRLSKADELLNRAQDLGNVQLRDAGLGGRGGGLLDALRSAIKDLDDDDKGKQSVPPSEGLGDALKDALAKHTPPPPPPDKEDDKKKLEPPPPPRNEEKKNPQLDALLAALKGAKSKGEGENKNSNKNEKGEAKNDFSLPEPKEPKDEGEKDEKKSSLLDKNEEPEDPSKAQALLDALKNQVKEPVKKSPLPPMQGGVGGGSFFGGGGDLGGGYGGGGGEMGPNIIGSASAPSGGSFDGDPFSGVGQVGFAGEGGKFALTKKVEYGSGGGSNADGGDEDLGGGGDFLDGAVAALRKSASRGATRLELLPVSKDGEKVMLLDYIGRLKETLCEEGRGATVAVCKTANAKRYREGWKQRLAE